MTVGSRLQYCHVMERANKPLLLIYVFQLCAPVNVRTLMTLVTTKQAVDTCTCVNTGYLSTRHCEPAVP